MILNKSFHNPCTYGNEECPKCTPPKQSLHVEEWRETLYKKLDTDEQVEIVSYVEKLLQKRDEELIKELYGQLNVTTYPFSPDFERAVKVMRTGIEKLAKHKGITI